MNYKSFSYRAVLILSVLMLDACGSRAIDLHDKSATYKEAMIHGCMTAEGNYTKNHHAFIEDAQYHEGWFFGRQYCEYNTRSGLQL